jgi:hypothetical protein
MRRINTVVINFLPRCSAALLGLRLFRGDVLSDCLTLASSHGARWRAATERHAGDLIGPQKPKAFFSVGHDEYWSPGQRAGVEAARAEGVSLAFFSGNEMY